MSCSMIGNEPFDCCCSWKARVRLICHWANGLLAQLCAAFCWPQISRADRPAAAGLLRLGQKTMGKPSSI